MVSVTRSREGAPGDHPLLLRDELLEHVVLEGAAKLLARHALLVRDGDVHRVDHGRAGVDREGGRDPRLRRYRRTAPPCLGGCRRRRPPCRPHRATSGRRSRAPSARACRRRSRARSAPHRSDSGTARSSPRRCRTRRTAASSTSVRGASSGRRPVYGSSPGNPDPPRSRCRPRRRGCITDRPRGSTPSRTGLRSPCRSRVGSSVSASHSA